MKYNAYIGTYSKRGSKGIYLAEVNAESGEMRIVDTYDEYNPSYLALSRNQKYLYCVLEGKEIDGQYGGGAASFLINDDGTLNRVSKAYTFGTNPCHLTTDEEDRFLYVANYSDGKLTVFPLTEGVIGSEPVIIAHQGSGPVKERQAGPHVHCVAFEKSGKKICVVDLGIDKAVYYRIEDGTLTEDNAFETDPGAGPRHVIFSEDGRFAWIVCELSNEVYALDAVKLSRIGVYKTLPGNFEGLSSCAAIKLSPDGKFICASNRGHDSISVFLINKDSGELELSGIYPSRGKTPRDFAFSPDGKFLYVTNQDSDTVEVFKMLKGCLEHTGQSINIPSPCCIIFRDTYHCL